ncbi:MAG TPA: hypothetical protein EYP56_07835 [Planctomycetaceae bacterium]|nr:hypothetical protein [Planctomycetaceae bacterium]HIQ19878.1 hypothetical protein [Planctomycetota bacterium]
MMDWRSTCLAPGLVGVLAAAALAQRTPVAVQLPTVSSFGVHTSVVVPDRGSTYLGGVNRAASGRNEFGVPLLKIPGFRNRAIGMERSASSMWVSVYVHDFEAMEEQLLSQSPGGSATQLSLRGPGWVSRKATPRAGQQPVASPVPSVAELRKRYLREQQTKQAEAMDFFRRGQRAERAGKLNVARIYYQMAQRRASGELKSTIAARLKLVSQAPVAKRGP